MSTQLSQRSRKLWLTWTHSGRTCTTSLWTRATNSDRPRNNMLLTRLLLMLRYGINTKLWILAHDPIPAVMKDSTVIFFTLVLRCLIVPTEIWTILVRTFPAQYCVWKTCVVYCNRDNWSSWFWIICSSVNGVWPTTIKLDLDMRVWI